MKIKLNYLRTLLYFFLISIVMLISVFIRNGQFKATQYQNVQNLDASYHVLLTIKALQENKPKDHLFLPIVTLGSQEDKNIPWGATVPDEKGNYYYTSFPQVGFITPYFIFSLFNIELTTDDLMHFNLVIHYLCSLLLGYLTFLITGKFELNIKHRYSLIMLASIVYIFNIEALFSHGVIYWAHSLFQLFWIIQLILLYLILEKGQNPIIIRTIYILFAFISFLLAATEWTGYLVNFALFLVFLNRYLKKRINLTPLLLIVISTIASILYYVIPFIIVIGQDNLVNSLKARFFARNITNSVGWNYLFKGYWESFSSYLIILCLFLFFGFFNKNFRERFVKKFMEMKLWLFVLIFPMIENLIMKQHAIAYSFDRLKLILVIIILLIICFSSIAIKQLKYFYILIIIGVVVTVFQFNNSTRIWKEPLLSVYKPMVNYIRDLGDVTLFNHGPVRGYVNLTLDSGVYEHIKDEKKLLGISQSKHKERSVWLLGQTLQNQLVGWRNAVVFNWNEGSIDVVGVINKQELANGKVNIHPIAANYLLDNNIKELNINKFQVAVKSITSKGSIILGSNSINLNSEGALFKATFYWDPSLTITSADLTDENWEFGINRKQPIILLENNFKNRFILEGKSSVIDKKGHVFAIDDVSLNDKWIHIRVKPSTLETLKLPQGFYLQ